MLNILTVMVVLVVFFGHYLRKVWPDRLYTTTVSSSMSKIVRPIKAQIVFSHVFTLTALLICSAVVYGVVM